MDMEPVDPSLWWAYALVFVQQAHSAIEGKTVLLVGSDSFRVESLLLQLGARQVIVMDHNPQTYAHDRIVSLPAGAYHDPAVASVDTIISFSSLDHDGLGRYGDPLCPDADLRSMDGIQDLMCRLQDRAPLLLLSVPVGADAVAWNMLRRYGPIRLPLLLDGFDKVHAIGWNATRLTADASLYRSYEPVFILKARPSACA